MDLLQIITSVLLASVSVNTWFVKRELTGLRQDSKDERDKRGVIENEIAAMKARCDERHSRK